MRVLLVEDDDMIAQGLQTAHGELRLDPVTRTVQRSGTPVSLSAHEYAVLEALLQRPGAELSRAQLEDWLYGWDEQIGS